jgi:hypothetical protein
MQAWVLASFSLLKTTASVLSGVILPGETKNFTFFFKSSKAGIFRESWEFGTHPTLLGGALLQVNLYAVSLAQDIFKDDRILLEVRDPGLQPQEIPDLLP